jgi:hypothetical protein
MEKILNFKIWSDVNEMARTPRKCPILDFTSLRQSPLYNDVISMGWVEVDASGSPRISAYQGEKLGNLRFKHSRLKNIIRVNRDGTIWEVMSSGKSHRIFLDSKNSIWDRECFNLKDYESRLEYLIKKILYEDGFITRGELSNSEGGIEIIKRIIQENPKEINYLKNIPDSLKSEFKDLLHSQIK